MFGLAQEVLRPKSRMQAYSSQTWVVCPNQVLFSWLRKLDICHVDLDRLTDIRATGIRVTDIRASRGRSHDLLTYTAR